MTDGRMALFEEATPEYRRPTMWDVSRVRSNGLTAVSTFSGCGGSCLGFKLAGFDVPYAVEFVDAAADTYAANFPAAVVDRRDIREIDPDQILGRLGLERGELDVLEGSPPCASFSAAGKREKLWGETKKYSDRRQRTDDLFDEYLRLLGGLRPRAFVAENVPGLATGFDDRAGEHSLIARYVREVAGRFAAEGYAVADSILTSANYGVPQHRRRLIFVGVRRDLGVLPSEFFPPPPTTPVAFTLRQALADAAGDRDHERFVEESSMRPYAVGAEWVKVREGGEARYFMLTVPNLDEPCPTLTATAAQIGAASVTRPTECRKLTPGEAKAVCGFPKDFVLTGTREQRVERMGRAVPPPMMAAVAGTVRDALRREES